MRDDEEEYPASSWMDDDFFEEKDYEDDDPWGCCCPAECLNPHYHHRLSECFTIEDIREPSRLRELWWRIKLWLEGTWCAAAPFRLCHDCGKPYRFFWLNRGDHSECLPF